MMEHLERVWQLPDDGIWEIRGPQRHFTQSKVMAWVAFDRAVKIVERTGRQGMPTDRWREIADQIKAEVCEKGFNQREEQLRAVLRLRPARLEPAHARPRRLPAAERSEDHRHRRGDRARADGRRLRAALPDLRRGLGRRPSRRRGHVPADDVLARRQPGAHRPREGGTRALRPPPRPAERRRHLLRGVRHRREADDRQLPPGVLAPRVHRVGVASVRGASVAARRHA